MSVKLAYALYTLKPALGSWKGGEGRHASFQLGLKGLAEAIGTRWPDELRSLHARLAQGLIERLTAHGDGTDDAATSSMPMTPGPLHTPSPISSLAA